MEKPWWLKLIQTTLTGYVVLIHLELKLLGLLPGEVLPMLAVIILGRGKEAYLVGEVAVLGRLEVDGVGELELLDNDTGAEVEVVLDDLNELIRRLVRSAIGLDEERQGLSDTDGVGKLDKRTAGQLGVDERLGDPAGEVGSGTVDLGVVLSEKAPPPWAPQPP